MIPIGHKRAWGDLDQGCVFIKAAFLPTSRLN